MILPGLFKFRPLSWLRVPVILTSSVVAMAACSENKQEVAVSADPTYVGSESCAGCHAPEFEAWQSSHHKLAMQPVSAGTVRGDFSGTSFDYAGSRYTFSKEGKDFVVEADDKDGQLKSFAVSHAYGTYPLQQFLVPFDDGRYQALSVAWDSRPVSKGGQRWFHLYPGENINHEDPLHWTGRYQNWNFMCADCHSTNLERNYDLASDTFDTSWSEVTVGCEACHGPGSYHAADPAAGLVDIQPQIVQVDTCARCHSRRSQLAEGFQPGESFLDYYQPSLLNEDLYFHDGQIKEEVYVYGSFLQSRMHQQGVTCSDCHEPHSATLKFEGNAVCTQCHQTGARSDFPTLKPVDYDSSQHHFHADDSDGAQCVNCHMTARTYMQVDPRRDHSFRVPRPDLSDALGTPNACMGCHTDKDNDWAVEQIRARYPDPEPQHFGELLHAGRQGESERINDLAMDRSQTVIVRATAISQSDDLSVLASATVETEPLLRLAAVEGSWSVDIQQRWPLLERLLDDQRLSVRTSAASALAEVPAEAVRQADAARLQKALDEYVDIQMLNADRPESLTNIGNVYLQTDRLEEAEAILATALEMDPSWTPALLSLVEALRIGGRDQKAVDLLRDKASTLNSDAALQYVYALALVRTGESENALTAFEKAALLDAGNASYRYAWAIALNSTGDSSSAVAVLEEAQARFPANSDILFALATIERDRGNLDLAINYAQNLVDLTPGNPDTLRLLQQLRDQK